MTLPELILKIRKEQGMTQAEMGERLGVVQRAVGMWEDGTRRPTGESLAALMLAYPEYQQDLLTAMVSHDQA